MPIDFSGINTPPNLLSLINSLSKLSLDLRFSIPLISSYFPKTVYPDVELEKFKYNCLKSGALNP